MRIPFAPIQKENNFTREWLQWFKDLGNSLNGLWGVQKRNFSGLVPSPDESYLSYSGREITFFLKWDAGVQFQNSKLILENKDLSMIGGKLLIFDGNQLVDTANCIDKEVVFPDIIVSNECIVQGTILTKDQRG
jgi:hypothetical protein